MGSQPGLLAVAREKMRTRHLALRTEQAYLQAQLEGAPWLVANLLYGSGLRLMEGLRLRVKDLALERGELIVREAKGGKDRVTMLPAVLDTPGTRASDAPAVVVRGGASAAAGRLAAPGARPKISPGSDAMGLAVPVPCG